MAKRSRKKKSPKISSSATVRRRGAPSPSGILGELKWGIIFKVALILVAGLWIYGPSLQGDWLWDDDNLVTGNSNLRTWDGLGKIWLSPPSTDYWPLTWTVLWIEWHLWGNQPLGYHLVSLLLHLTSGFLIWRLFGRLGLRHGWIGGLLFVIHPLAVESVAWISEIKNTLSLPFFLLSFDAWLDEEQGKRSGYLRSLLYYLAAVLGKTSTIMLPFVLLWHVWWKRGTVTTRDIKKVVPYLAGGLVLGLLTLHFQATHTDHPVHLGNLFSRSMGAGTAIFFYLGKFLVPVGLLPIYPQWNFSAPLLLEVLTLPLLGMLLLCLWRSRRIWRREVLFGLGFFVINLLPVLGFFKMVYLNLSLVADHFVYLPMIGLIGLVLAAGEALSRQWSSWSRPLGMILVAALGLALAWESRQYAGMFINQETLWTYAIAGNPQAYVAYNNLGETARRAGRFQEAIRLYRQALQINPQYAEAHNNLGAALQSGGQESEAMEQEGIALQIDPRYAGAHANLGDALQAVGRVSEAMEQERIALQIEPELAEAHNNLGVALGKSGQVSEAIEHYEQAFLIKPDYAEAHNNLGNALQQSGQPLEAIKQFKLALQIKPEFAEAHYNLGNTLRQSGRTAEAREQFELALQTNPQLAQAHNDLGGALLQSGQLPEAIEQYEQTLRLNPKSAETHYNLGNALGRSGRLSEARTQFEEALQIDPELAQAHNGLGFVLMQSGQMPEALEQFKQALRILPDYAEARNNLLAVQRDLLFKR